MEYIKASTKKGMFLLHRGECCEGYTLEDIYNSYSTEKHEAYVNCLEKYLSGIGSHDFHICSHNTFQFTVAWYEKREGEKVLRIETANNSYCIWMER